MSTRKEVINRLEYEISLLPEQLQDQIWNYYYSYISTTINKQITQPRMVETKLFSYFDTVIKMPIFMKAKHIPELQELNFHLSKIIENPGLLLICKRNNLFIRYCFNLPSYLIADIHPTLIYVAYFCICSMGILSYTYLKNFKELSAELKSS